MSAEEANTSLPIDKLPSDWNDINKLNNFYSPVRNRQVNPLDWGSKLDFWKSSIEIYCNHNKLYSFSFTQLQKGFLHMGRTPPCLKEILEELVRQGDVIPLNDFLYKAKPHVTWSGWAASTLLKRPLSWTFNKVKTSIVSLDVTNVEYVHIKVVKQEALELSNKTPLDFKDKVIELREFAKVLGREDNIGNLKVLLHYLETDGKVSMREINQNGQTKMTLVQFASEGMVKPILEIDVDIYVLTMKEKTLQKDIERLEISMEVLHKQAKEHVKNKHKQLALTILRKKKLVEKSIEHRAKNALNVSTILQNLQDAAHNQEVISTYKNAIKNFKASYLSDLNPDNVDETMASLGEQIDLNNDIQSTLAQSFDITDDDLETELAELMAENDTPPDSTSPKANVADITQDLENLNLPNVPATPERVGNMVNNPVLH